MANIRFNQSFFSVPLTSGGTGSLISPVYYTGSASNISGFADSVTRLGIFKGSVPSFPSFTNVSTRAADLLILFPLPSDVNSYETFSDSSNFRLRLGIKGSPQAASAAGTATWFILQYANDDLSVCGAMIGTVGNSGSGADLEVPSTAITVGPLYTSSGIYINFPLNQTF